MEAYQHRDSTVQPPVQVFAVHLRCACGSVDQLRDDVSLGELVDMLACPAMRGYPDGCLCELEGAPLGLEVSA